MFVAMRCRGMLVVRRGGVRFTGMFMVLVAIVLGTSSVIGVGRVFARVLFVSMLVMGVLVAVFVAMFILGLLGRGSGSRCLDCG